MCGIGKCAKVFFLRIEWEHYDGAGKTISEGQAGFIYVRLLVVQVRSDAGLTKCRFFSCGYRNLMAQNGEMDCGQRRGA